MPSPGPAFPSFRSVTVRNPTADSLLVRWSIVPTSYDMSQILFEILRSNGPKGPWEVAGTAEPGAFHYTDYQPVEVHGFRATYYIVRILDISGAGYIDSKPVQLDHDPDNIALGMIRKKNVFLRTRGGVAAAVLLRKRWGPKCPRCWDDVRKLCIQADCPICFGVGIIGGFLNPVFLNGALFNQSVKQYVTVNDARYDAANFALEFANVPPLAPDDLIVDRVVNARYIVKKVTPFTHKMYLVSQTIEVTRKDENDVVYTIPIPEDKPSIKGESYNLAVRD